MAEDSKRPIIIRRKVVQEHGHHGGAWKVAYADFVTAMMAFFLLMWLLNATTEDQRKGLADYFSPSIPVHRTSGGGDGPFGGTSIASERAMSQSGTGATRERPSSERQARGETGTDRMELREQTLDGIAQALLAQSGESAVADRLLQHIRTRVTDEGLVIEVFDLPGRPLFTPGSAQPTDTLRELAALIGDAAGVVTNAVAVDNHLSAAPIQRVSTGWELSSRRALAVRGLLAEAGIAQPRFARVTGEADRAPAVEDPMDPRNMRTEIVLIRSDPAE